MATYKRLLLIIFLIFSVILISGCEPIRGINEVKNSDYVSIRLGEFDGRNIWYVDSDNVFLYDEEIYFDLRLAENKMYVYYTIDHIPFYALVNNKEIEYYTTSLGSRFIRYSDVRNTHFQARR